METYCVVLDYHFFRLAIHFKLVIYLLIHEKCCMIHVGFDAQKHWQQENIDF